MVLLVSRSGPIIAESEAAPSVVVVIIIIGVVRLLHRPIVDILRRLLRMISHVWLSLLPRSFLSVVAIVIVVVISTCKVSVAVIMVVVPISPATIIVLMMLLLLPQLLLLALNRLLVLSVQWDRRGFHRWRCGRIWRRCCLFDW